MQTKTTLSIPDDVFAAAEVLAHRLGLSRGALYALAIAEFVEGHRRLGAREPREAGGQPAGLGVSRRAS